VVTSNRCFAREPNKRVTRMRWRARQARVLEQEVSPVALEIDPETYKVKLNRYLRT
jgi:hypothetical protein